MIKKKNRRWTKNKSILPILFYRVFLNGISCLTMEGIVIPPYVLQGESAELRCLFRLDRDSLYSVTWYKDHEEFYRYVPRDNPKQRTYRLEGAKIDQQRSGAHEVKLRAATSAASGLYRCEVSAEAPSFTSAHAEGRMDVVALPEQNPLITGHMYSRDYREGDILALNCTAGKSYPSARIAWFVNDRQVPSWFESRGGADGATTSGLRVRLSRSHFPRGLLAVRCAATVGPPLPPLDTRETFLLVHGSSETRGAVKIIILECLLLHIINICIRERVVLI